MLSATDEERPRLTTPQEIKESTPSGTRKPAPWRLAPHSSAFLTIGTSSKLMCRFWRHLQAKLVRKGSERTMLLKAGDSMHRGSWSGAGGGGESLNWST